MVSRAEGLCGSLSVPAAYAKWCAESADGVELQGVWRRPMWGEGRGLRSNVNPGDRIMHGDKNWKSRYPQISLVVHKLLILGIRCEADHDVSAPAERIDRFEYRIGWRTGGHSPDKTHGDLTCGYWIWIPWFEQLVAFGFDADRAARLVLGQEDDRK